MCGRYTLSATAEEISEVFELDDVPAIPPRYNIAPTQLVPAIRSTPDGPARSLYMLHWGLIPSWADGPAIGNKLINARAETVAIKPSFRSSFKSRRCLMVADGFYEWRKVEKGKQPYCIRRADGRPFAFAGLWERWMSPDGTEVESCAVITTEPNELMRTIHDRMPVILEQDAWRTWLNPAPTKPEVLQELLVPLPASLLRAYPVSTKVNNPRFDRPECADPMPE